MLTERTTTECVATLVHEVDRHIANDLCHECAFRLSAKTFKMELTKVERIWMRQKELLAK